MANFHFAAFHFGEIQNVVDHVEQHAAGALDVADVAALLVVERVDAAEDFAESENAVERRAELVAHRGEEVALEPVHFVEPHVRLGELVEPLIEFAFALLELALLAEELPQHAVERGAEFLELIAGADDGPLLDVALADGVGDIAKVGHRLDDDVSHDRPEREHRHEADDDRGRPEVRAVLGDFVGGRRVSRSSRESSPSIRRRADSVAGRRH